MEQKYNILNNFTKIQQMHIEDIRSKALLDREAFLDCMTYDEDVAMASAILEQIKQTPCSEATIDDLMLWCGYAGFWWFSWGEANENGVRSRGNKTNQKEAEIELHRINRILVKLEKIKDARK
jgi:hypothetical protein